MTASLPMYARASNRAAHDALWALIKDGLHDRAVAAPDTLDHDIDHIDSWAHPNLVLGQICNLPLRTTFADKVTPIGAADYGLEGCPLGYYRSVFVVRNDCPATSPQQMAKTRFVFNEPLSQSGYGSAQVWAQEHGFAFVPFLKTGSHRASIAAVATGNGDIAAIDAQTWLIECAENTQTKRLKIIGHTNPSPGMTFITRKGQDSRPYFDAIHDAITQLAPKHAQVLRLKSIVALPKVAYDLPFAPNEAAIMV